MRKLTQTISVAAGLILTGCLTLATNPFYTDADVVRVPEIDGVWSDEQDGGQWTFVPEDDTSSYVVFTDEKDGPDGEFEAHLFRLDGVLYMDMLPAEPEQVSDFQIAHFIPAHSIWRVTLTDDVLTLNYIDIEKFKSGVREGTFDIAHVWNDDILVLTAETPELQQFLTQHMGTLVSEEPFVLSRGK